MSRRLVNLTLDTLGDLPHPCRECVFWELDPAAAKAACATGDPGLDKEAWISQTLLEWGSCGKLLYLDDVPAGYVMYAPPAYLPGGRTFPTSPPSTDAALLTIAYVSPAHVGSGLGRMLVQGAARDLTTRGLKAIEAFGEACEPNREHGGVARYGEPDPAVETGRRCVAPADFYVAVGFKTVRPHPRYPRLRLELRTALSWRSDVAYALDELLETIGPVGSYTSAEARLARRVRTSIEPVATSASTG
jgi:GNAT superfamily N-acetyltransferase